MSYGSLFYIFSWVRSVGIAHSQVRSDKDGVSRRSFRGTIDHEEELEREIVHEVIAENPPREKGVRDGWVEHWGIGRKYDPSQ